VEFNTLSGLPLTLTALSGKFPTAQIDLLPSTAAYREKVVKSLKTEKLLRSYYRDGLRGLRLTSSAKKLLTDNQPDWFRPLFSGDTATNAPKYTIVHRLRLHRMSEVLVTMDNANLIVLPWEKPLLFNPTPPADPPFIGQPSYYSSREIKELGELAVQIRGSRSTGILLADDVIFSVYKTPAPSS